MSRRNSRRRQQAKNAGRRMRGRLGWPLDSLPMPAEAGRAWSRALYEKAQRRIPVLNTEAEVRAVLDADVAKGCGVIAIS